MRINEHVQLFLVEGTIQSMRVAAGTVNLVKDIQKGALFTGAGSGLAGEAGMLANAASLALDEGEEVEHIALLINGQLAVGTFQWLRDLNAGDGVKLVVSALDDGLLFIHAILRIHDQLLWTPYGVDHTRRGWIFHGIKLGGVITLSTWVFALICNHFMPTFGVIDFLLWICLSSGLMMALVIFLSTRDVIYIGEQAEYIFKALGVPDYKRFRIKPFSIMTDYSDTDDMPDREKKGHIFKFADALATHKKKFNLP